MPSPRIEWRKLICYNCESGYQPFFCNGEKLSDITLQTIARTSYCNMFELATTEPASDKD